MPTPIDVLVVDDDPGVARLLVTALRRAGWSVEAAADADEALARLGRLQPRLVISDLTLPGRDGLSLLRTAEAAGHRFPFLLMSAWLPEDLRAVILDDPAITGLLDKPFDLQRLEQDVRAALGCGSRPTTPRETGPTSRGASSKHGPRAGLRAPRAWFPGATGGGLGFGVDGSSRSPGSG